MVQLWHRRRKEGDGIDTSAQGPQAVARRFYVVFHVFRGRQPDLPARSWRRDKLLARLSGACHQCRGSARGRGHRGGTGRRSGQVGRAGAPGIRTGIHDLDLPVHRAVSGYSAHRKYLLCHAYPAAGQQRRVAAGVLRAILWGSLSGGAAPGQAHPLAGQAALPLPAGSDSDPVRRLSAAPAGGAVRCAHRDVSFHGRVTGRIVRLPDHGRPCGAELWRGHCHEHPGARR